MTDSKPCPVCNFAPCLGPKCHIACKAKIASMREEMAKVTKERDDIAALVGGDATVARINYEGAGPIEVALRHPLVVAMVMAAFDTLDSAGAENFVTCDYTHPDTGRVLSAIYQMKGGKTPYEALSEARSDLAESNRERDAAMLARARGEMGSGDFATVRGEDGIFHYCTSVEDVLRALYPRHADRLIAERDD